MDTRRLSTLTAGRGGATLGARWGPATGSRDGAASDDLAPGTRIGRYTVVRRLGSGAMGVVVAAYDQELERGVAIKVLRAHRSNTKASTRLQREAQAMAKVAHPNVVAVYDVGRHGPAEQVFIAMEFVGRKTLKEWMAKAHGWREVLDALEGAGRGLQAAHEAGLIHRDFKPDNVLVTSDGKLKVSDFGLVRARRERENWAREDEGGGGEGAGDEDGLVTASGDAFMAPITQVGALIGTPAFMAPEQFLGQTADARSDQFAFCVTLHIALFGVPPFKGRRVEEIRESVVMGQRRERPLDREVPAWVTAVVDRGLARRPEDRWPSMAALLEALGDDPSIRRKRWLVAGALMALFGGTAIGLMAHEGQARAGCEAAAARVDERWEAVDDKLRESMLATEVGYARDVWSRTEAGFGEWAGRWRIERRRSCEGEYQGEALGVARSACLDAELDEVDATLELLGRGDRVTVAYAVEAVSKLPPPERCADPLWLAKFHELGLDGADTRERASRTRREIVKSGALQAAGKPREALSIARATLASAPDRGALRAEALLALGQAADAATERAEAQDRLLAAYFEGAAVGHDRVALLAAFELGDHFSLSGDEDSALVWHRQAESLARRLGSRPEDRVALEQLRGHILWRAKDLDGAELALRAALLGAEEHYPPGHPEISALLRDLGHLQILRGEQALAAETLGRARRLLAESLGPEHPEVAMIDLRLAEAKRDGGDIPGAIESLEEVVAVLDAAYGDSHLNVASAFETLAVSHAMAGRFDVAVGLQARAVAISEAVLGPDNPQLLAALSHQGRMERALGHLDEALALFERSAALAEAVHGREHHETAAALYEIARTRELSGAPASALLPIYEEVHAAHVEHYGEGHDQTITIALSVAAAQCELGRTGEGIARLERALELGTARSEGGELRLTNLQASLGECLVRAGRGAEAARMFEDILAARFAELGQADPMRARIAQALALVHLDLGEPEAALRSMAVAASVFQLGLSSTPQERAAHRIARAQVMWRAGGDLPGAQALIDEGLAEFAAQRSTELSPGASAEVLDTLEASVRHWQGEGDELGAEPGTGGSPETSPAPGG